jgi:pimeloyl-ACP methyl ester carboxylesterase
MLRGDIIMKQTELYDENELISESPLEPWGKFIKLDGSETFVVEMGEGENIIFANGIAASVHTWRKVLPILSKVFHVFALDYKGTGFSEKAKDKYSVELFSKQIFQLIKHFRMDKAILVGNSLGGETILDFAINHPNMVKALILIDTAGYQNNKEITGLLVRMSRCKFVGRLLQRYASKKFARKIIKWALYNDRLVDREMVDAYYKPMKTEGAADAFIELVRNLSYTKFDYKRVTEITVPTLIIWGEDDKWIPVTDAYKFHRDIKGSQLTVLERCGHAPQEEKPEEVSRLIEEFINKNVK